MLMLNPKLSIYDFKENSHLFYLSVEKLSELSDSIQYYTF